MRAAVGLGMLGCGKKKQGAGRAEWPRAEMQGERRGSKRIHFLFLKQFFPKTFSK
jgi:hypothetical protein